MLQDENIITDDGEWIYKTRQDSKYSKNASEVSSQVIQGSVEMTRKSNNKYRKSNGRESNSKMENKKINMFNYK